MRAVSPPSVLLDDSRPPTAFSNSLMSRMPLSVVAIERARLIVMADEPITPPPSPITLPKSRSRSDLPNDLAFIRQRQIDDLDLLFQRRNVREVSLNEENV